jgi:hypothetical protein
MKCRYELKSVKIRTVITALVVAGVAYLDWAWADMCYYDASPVESNTIGCALKAPKGVLGNCPTETSTDPNVICGATSEPLSVRIGCSGAATGYSSFKNGSDPCYQLTYCKRKHHLSYNQYGVIVDAWSCDLTTVSETCGNYWESQHAAGDACPPTGG